MKILKQESWQRLFDWLLQIKTPLNLSNSRGYFAHLFGRGFNEVSESESVRTVNIIPFYVSINGLLYALSLSFMFGSGHSFKYFRIFNGWTLIRTKETLQHLQQLQTTAELINHRKLCLEYSYLVSFKCNLYS